MIRRNHLQKSVAMIATLFCICTRGNLAPDHKVLRPQCSSFIERRHRTLLDEHFCIKGRTTWYKSVEQMQTDLDSYLEHDNNQLPYQDRMMEGPPLHHVQKVSEIDTEGRAH